MKVRLTRKEAWIIYSAILAGLLGLFVVGLHLGRTKFPGASETSSGGDGATEVSYPAEPGTVQLFEGLGTEDSLPTQNSVAQDPAGRVPDGAGGDQGIEEPVEVLVDSTAASAARAEDQAQEAVEPPPARLSAPVGGFTIQVAAHSSMQEAEQSLIRLEAKQFPGRIRPPAPGDRDRYYRVWVGEFPSIEAARDLEGQLKEAGFLTYIRRIE